MTRNFNWFGAMALLKPGITIDRDQALPDMKTLDQLKLESMASNRLNSIMLAGFATVALLLSAIGIYGVISYAVVQRTHEIGIRAALGASRTNVLSLILKHGIVMIGTGLVLGLLGTLGLTRLLAKLLFGVSSHDPMTIAAVCAILALVAVMASYVPAWRAAKVDPMICLRYE
jgi:putative ABC transport system permease protein